jgi:hypothetical protein
MTWKAFQRAVLGLLALGFFSLAVVEYQRAVHGSPTNDSVEFALLLACLGIPASLAAVLGPKHRWWGALLAISATAVALAIGYLLWGVNSTIENR